MRILVTGAAGSIGSHLVDCTTLQHLADRILSETGSSSQVQIVPPRSVEVERFTTDLTRFKAVFRRGAGRTPALPARRDFPHKPRPTTLTLPHDRLQHPRRLAGDYRYDWAGWGAPRLLAP